MFYALWQKSLSSDELMLITMLSTLTVVQAYFNSVTSTMAQLSVVVNKLKLPVFVSLGCGIVSIAAEIVLIKCFGLGLYAIVLSTTVVMIVRYVIFNSFYGGIFTMALVEALHYYGIASCILQNGEYKERNLKFKEICKNIPENEKIILFIAIGYYKDNFTYAVSHRKNLEDVLIIR